MRLAVVGGGIAGSMLALRVLQRRSDVALEVFTGGRLSDVDATSASGGLVRAFETDLVACELATASMIELRNDRWLRDVSEYRDIGSTYVLPAGSDVSAQLAVIDRLMPGSIRQLCAREAQHRFGFANLAARSCVLVEQQAGYLSPAALRSAVRTRVAARGTTVTDLPVTGLIPGPAVTLADGSERTFDAVVVAAGAWTPALLDTSAGLRTRQIQYGVYPVAVPAVGCFVDDVSGLYGRPVGTGSFLLGMATARWDVDPGNAVVDAALADRVGATARRLFDLPNPPRPGRLVAAPDCFAPRGGLLLRSVPELTGVFTFTGGGGGAAKTVLAASRQAANALLNGAVSAGEAVEDATESTRAGIMR